MSTYQYVIVGGGLAAQRAADNIRQVDEQGSIALITAENHLPYERPPLSKGYLTGKKGLDAVYLKERGYYDERGIELIMGTRATSIDRSTKAISLESGSMIRYGQLLLATGGSPRRLPLPGADLSRVFTLRTIEDADAIRAAAQPGTRALVLGGSFIGSEVAASLTELGADVSMVFPGERLLERVVSEDLSSWIEKDYARRGVMTLAGTRPLRLSGNQSVEAAELDNGQSLVVDLVVMGVGIRLNTNLAADAGLDLEGRGAVRVDEFLRTSDPHIWAAGDIAAWPDPTFGQRLRVEHWNVARTQGLRAGRNMAGEVKPYTTLPYFYSDLFDLGLEAWGNLDAWDRTVMRGSLERGSFAYYYFNDSNLVGVLAANRSDEERKPMQALVKARPSFESVAKQLQREDLSLNELLN